MTIAQCYQCLGRGCVACNQTGIVGENIRMAQQMMAAHLARPKRPTPKAVIYALEVCPDPTCWWIAQAIAEAAGVPFVEAYRVLCAQVILGKLEYRASHSGHAEDDQFKLRKGG